MNRNCIFKIEIVFVVCCMLLFQVCCHEQAKLTEEPELAANSKIPSPPPPPKESVDSVARQANKGPSTTQIQPKTTSVAPKTTEKGSQPSEKSDQQVPTITFEKLIHDFGEVGPRTSNVYEFKFTNTGNALLKINGVQSTCGCAVAKLAKKEYSPGESGVVKVTYSSGPGAGSTTKRLYVRSNDKAQPSLALTIKARITQKIKYEPERLNLLLNKSNAGCSEITLDSRDTQAFAIRGFKSTGSCITADYDSSVKSTKFVLKPKVNIEKLRSNLRGQIQISLTHPECRTISISYDTLPEFKVNPRVIHVREAKPMKAIKRDLWVLSNYNEDFKIESASSSKGVIKVLNRQKVSSGYQFELEITPPAVSGETKVFTDVFLVKIEGGERLQISCYGIYSKEPTKSSG